MKSILSKEEAVKHNIFLFASLPVGFKTSLKLFKGQKVFSFNYLVTHKYLNIKLTIMEIFCYTNVTWPFAQSVFHTSYIIWVTKQSKACSFQIVQMYLKMLQNISFAICKETIYATRAATGVFGKHIQMQHFLFSHFFQTFFNFRHCCKQFSIFNFRHCCEQGCCVQKIWSATFYQGRPWGHI